MGLIDRALDAAPSPETAVDSWGVGEAPARKFRLDLKALTDAGLYAGVADRRAQALELRAVKRALVKRLGFLRNMGRAGRDPGTGGARQQNVVLVTSTRPSEGKTFFAINLALSFAVEERRPVLLIDGDAPRPQARRQLGLPEGPGLTDLLCDPDLMYPDVAWRAANAPLEVLGEGREGREEASALFASHDARGFFQEASTRRPERLIIVDAPPVLAATEALALARHADLVTFVVQADATPEPAVAAALDDLLDINANVGLVLNRTVLPAGGAHYGSYEYYSDGERASRRRDAAA